MDGNSRTVWHSVSLGEIRRPSSKDRRKTVCGVPESLARFGARQVRIKHCEMPRDREDAVGDDAIAYLGT